MKPTTRSKLTIGVSGASARTKSVRAMMKQVRDEGCVAVFLESAHKNLRLAIESDLARIEALVVMGNDRDIDPKHYIHRYADGDPKRAVHPQTKNESGHPKGNARARYEEAAIKKALERGMPLLGICGGMQRINVICGGTLHQHIPDLVGCDKHMQQRRGIAPHIAVVPILIKDGTTLAQIAGSIKMPFVKDSDACPKVIMENSMHHQAIDRIASQLRVCALTDTVKMQGGTMGYLAEAVEADPEGEYGGQCILGVQWHPEFGASSLGQKIVRHMIAAAQDFARARRPKGKALSFAFVSRIQASDG